MSTLNSLLRSQEAKRMRRRLEKAFPHAQFRVQVYENGEWDVWFSNNMKGREEEMAEVLADEGPQWYGDRKTRERTYLHQ